jgi:serum/glucocorticoid-regulated kinase 2
MEDTSLDLLHFRNEKSIIKGLGNGEHIILTVALYKFNESNKRQERNLMITNKKIYNLNKTSITRSTNICKVYAVTLSITGSEFVIHIPDEYDYRYASFDRRDEVIISILRARG